ncbi:MAG: hypothetical protein ACYTF8_14915 [Planctomycetota bacterium]|jgi:hypothetical protein
MLMLAQLQLVPPHVVRWVGFVVLFLLVTPLFPFTYVVLRWRSGGENEPGSGTYAGLLYFATAGLLLALAGAANLTYGWMSTTEIVEEQIRLSWGMFVGSALFLGLNLALLRRHGPRPRLRDARRVFGGFLMVMAGLVTFAAVVLFFVEIFREASTEREVIERADDLKAYGAWAGYYLLTYLAAVTVLARGARD